jgi:hypothetical protein
MGSNGLGGSVRDCAPSGYIANTNEREFYNSITGRIKKMRLQNISAPNRVFISPPYKQARTTGDATYVCQTVNSLMQSAIQSFAA